MELSIKYFSIYLLALSGPSASTAQAICDAKGHIKAIHKKFRAALQISVMLNDKIHSRFKRKMGRLIPMARKTPQAPSAKGW